LIAETAEETDLDEVIDKIDEEAFFKLVKEAEEQKFNSNEDA
jgi:hypothetical protein